MNKDAVAEMSRQYQVEAAEKVVPEGYKQTELGVIPEDWAVWQLNELCTFENGDRSSNYPTSGSFVSSGFPFINAGHIDEGLIYIDGMDYITSEAFEKLGGGKVRPRDILFCLRGSLGKFGVVSESLGEGAIASSLVIIRPNKRKVVLEVLTSGYLKSKICKEMIELWSGGAAQPNLGAKELGRFLVPLPPTINEQKAIASALSDTDALLSELEKLIAKKQAIKTATMQQLLTGRTRLPQFAHHPDGSKKGYKKSELGEIPDDWEAIQLGEIATFIKGAGLPKSDLIDSGKNRCIHYGQLFTTYGPKIEKILSSTDIDGSIKSEINDILMPTSDVTPNGLATASCILESGIVLGGDILIIRTKKELLNGVFFAYLITVMRDQVMQLVTGSTVYHLYGSDMAKFLFAKPVLEEQTAIATILSDMDSEIQALEQRLNKTRQIKQGMMQELLTGKTRLVTPQVQP
ncbi:restriction endonuclease subunit S [Parahaliea sp. F7430]|uniref:Restriction endonuclease subunit S n=1 Tax=Sediminihaliea albiluteola TaxID=2758564 RepID=A0A7W2YI74_9GAMM|nr:restriction endonuclease subunit S [Sediminihaliea albiluteola]MBA6411755.1 restriction endonuclease subunit S [Sediminihaliea albiluteola]